MLKKIILKNVKKSSKDYIMYMITLALCVTMFYSFAAISSRYYHPSLSLEFNIDTLGREIKLAVCCITLILIFLIHYINGFMLRKRQKEFSLQTILGMERTTTGLLFEVETGIMGLISLAIGILCGSFTFELINALLVREFGGKYKWEYSIYPDTALITILIFGICFLIIGILNVRKISKLSVIDMLNDSRKTESHINLQKWKMVWIVFGMAVSAILLISSVQNLMHIYDNRLAFIVKMILVINMITPSLFLIVCFLNIRNMKLRITTIQIFSALFEVLAVFLLVVLGKRYLLPIRGDIYNRYLIMMVAMIVFCIILSFSILVEWINYFKIKSYNLHYKNNRLFIGGQITAKLETSAKIMAIICVTFVSAILLLFFSVILSGWIKGFHDKKDIFDIQISTRYNKVIDQKNLKSMDLDFINDFIEKNDLDINYSNKFDSYFLNAQDFKNRNKYNFPVLVIRLSDYNKLLKMINKPSIKLNENQFLIQFNNTVTPKEKNTLSAKTQTIEVASHKFILADSFQYDLGEDIYNSYTDMIYVLPDQVTNSLLAARHYWYINTNTVMSYSASDSLRQKFEKKSNIEFNITQNLNSIRIKTLENNTSISYSFLVRAIMLYAGVVMLVISFTILSVQQLIDVDRSKIEYRIIKKLGMEQNTIMKIIMQQIIIWFLLPIVIAILLAALIITCFLIMNYKEMMAFIGINFILDNVGSTFAFIICGLVLYLIGACKTYDIALKDRY